MSLTQKVSHLVTTALRRIQSKLSFDDWSAYPQFSTEKVRVSGLFCVVANVSHLVLGSRSRGHVGMYIGHSIGNTRACGASDQFTPIGNNRITTSGRSTWTQSDATILAVVRVCGRSLHLPLIGIFCHCRVQSHCNYFELVLDQSFPQLHCCCPGEYAMNDVAAAFVLISWTIRQLSWIEFLIRFWVFPQLNTKYMLIMGIAMTTTAQFIRSLAMVTCGESFNHMIQRSKKDNHKLITHGM